MDHDSGDHKQHGAWSGVRSSVNGGHFLKSNFFIFLLGQIVTLVCGLVVAGTIYGRVTQQFTELEKWHIETAATISRMDTFGTNASKWAIADEYKRIEANTSAIRELQDQTRKLDVMAEKISRIDEILKRLDSAKK